MWDDREVIFESNICRLCGCSGDHVISLSTQDPSEDASSIISIIERLIPMKIEMKDKKPKQVCSLCASKLEDFSNFVSMCLSTDLTFNSLIESIKSVQAENRNNENNLDLRKDNLWSEEDKGLLGQGNNVILVSKNADNPVQNQDFYLMLELNYKGVDIDPVFIKCNDSETSANVVKFTSQNNSNNSECDEIKDDMSPPCNTNIENTEVAKKEKKTKEFKCNICNKSLTRRSNLVSHLSLHSKERPHKCLECGKSFAILWDLTIHKHIHSGSFVCDVCNKPFVTKSKLERHSKSHSGIKEHPCPICKKTFAEKNNMITHMTIHTGVKPFSCSLCKKSFRTQSHLTDHKKVHSAITPFKCNICDKSFKWKSNLRDHSKFHSGEGFKCNTCQKEFNVRTDFYKHRKECRDNKNRCCEICSQLFCNNEAYQTHMKSEHKEDHLLGSLKVLY